MRTVRLSLAGILLSVYCFPTALAQDSRHFRDADFDVLRNDYLEYRRTIDRTQPEWWVLPIRYCSGLCAKNPGLAKASLARITALLSAQYGKLQKDTTLTVQELSRLPLFEYEMYLAILQDSIRANDREALVSTLSVYVPDRFMLDDFEFYLAKMLNDNKAFGPATTVLADALEQSDAGLSRMLLERIIRRAVVGYSFAHESGAELARGVKNWHLKYHSSKLNENYGKNIDVRMDDGQPQPLYVN